MTYDSKRLLLVTHVSLRLDGDRLLIDDQTAAGLRQWCRHFDAVTYYGVEADADDSSVTWVDVSDRPFGDRCELHALPRAYKPQQMARSYRQTRATLARAIASHHYLCFTIGGLVGDWPAVAALEASRQGRPYAAWLDRVEPAIIRQSLGNASLKRRLGASATLPLMERYHRHLLKRSRVALLQGGDTFEHYRPWNENSHCIYDTHTTADDQIGPAQLEQKRQRVRSEQPLAIIYVGRAAEMKGPDDWLDVLEGLARQNVPFQARWIGDGPALADMRHRVDGGPLRDRVQLTGFEGDRDAVFAALRASDIVLYCHKTPESPRSLIEALVAGCPIVGYETAYPRELTRLRGGGAFAPQDDVEGLVATIARLHRDRALLERLVTAAAASGSTYDEDTVYAARAALMQQAGSAPRQ
ncbi:hypothetical protein VW29_04085 [Devosia limi DSM 17137]|uniref:Glycosyl transferases group 1 n=1 Tax=Devosia limi DSM 17137 TaxID=1121477 RepID=A0A0F5LV85_9HYPH|nr:glycosyltransferase [Devosia limi]KKB86074.1 hypothetical protein VW29_04085 [Devosia limi DSM 17137]SHF84228.1 Glycosyl transferases group 1 [Devosia limi DSM 17137]